MTPSRIQRQRTKGWRMPPNTVCVSRPSLWGNQSRLAPAFESPSVRIPEITPQRAVEAFREVWERVLRNRPTMHGCRLCPQHAAARPKPQQEDAST